MTAIEQTDLRLRRYSALVQAQLLISGSLFLVYDRAAHAQLKRIKAYLKTQLDNEIVDKLYQAPKGE
jgi:hypothetical protein